MDPDYWHQKWANRQVNFHQPQPNALLVEHLSALALLSGARILVPLCGKSLDIHWLLDQGYHVVGAELSRLAVEELYAELGHSPTLTTTLTPGPLDHFSAPMLDVFAGDIFHLTSETLGPLAPIDAIYDRAALVALPPDTRTRYAHHLQRLTRGAPQLLLTFEYDQNTMPGPPFSVPAEEVHRHYAPGYSLTELARQPVPGGLKGFCPAEEIAWHVGKKF
ncbi:MAG: thiopurine S-methyltransferase [Bryobacter sp.]|nr:thiopurine S-methyltransferase [Bryobacter sp.]